MNKVWVITPSQYKAHGTPPQKTEENGITGGSGMGTESGTRVLVLLDRLGVALLAVVGIFKVLSRGGVGGALEFSK